jgi:CxxC motif-containing protein (DUF1111 family)
MPAGRHYFVLAAAIAAACSGSGPALDPLADPTGQVGTREVIGTAFGDPLPQLSADQQTRFVAGRKIFFADHAPVNGLGPVMTGSACLTCHDTPTAGGTNQRLETRFGRRNPDGSYDPLISLGGPLQQDEAIPGFTAEVVPSQANVVAQRRTTPLFGLGLVDAVPDATFEALAALQAHDHPEAAGRPAHVQDLVTGTTRVARFGWKAGRVSVFQFNADASLNELGITNPLFPNENWPQGNAGTLTNNPMPSMNDPNGDFVTAVNDFVQVLAPPPGARLGSSSGQGVFVSVGCATCHVPTLVTGSSTDPSIDRVAFHPFSDFLLHDMGALGDGIDELDAHAREMRTAPLWGLSQQSRLLHDGRVNKLDQAILAHDGQGKAARDRFAALADTDRAALLAFLSTL